MKATRFYQRFQRYLSANLPDDHDNVIEVRQIRTLNVIILFVGLLAAPLILNYLRMDLYFMSGAILVAILFAFFTSWLLTRTRRYVLCGHLALLDYMAIILLSNSITGGFENSNFGIFYSVPIIAAFILGIPAVIFYSALTLGIILCFFIMDAGGVEIPYLIPEESRKLQSLLDRLFVLTMLAAVSIGFLFHRNFTEKQLQLSRIREEELHRSKSRFFANMSHEIRTPMNSVIGLTEMLSMTLLDQTQEKYVKSINRSGNTLLRVINDVLDYSFIESGKLSINRKPFSLHEFLIDLINVYQNQRSPAVSFDVHIDEEVPACIATDETRLHQILSNLLNNAFKFTESGSVELNIHISTQNAQSILHCTIKDTGIGISEEGQKALFTAFSREELSDSRKFGGTGLGLNICKMLIDMMGGTISCSSNLDHGTTMQFQVPIEVIDSLPDNSTAYARNNTENTDALKGLKVLIAEDNPSNQLVIKAFLNRLNIDCTLCDNGEEALHALQDENAHYDILLLDCEMPVKDGFETARSVRSWEAANNRNPIFISAFTAHAFDETINRCIDSGMDAYIAKPLKMADLINILSKAINKDDKKVELAE